MELYQVVLCVTQQSACTYTTSCKGATSNGFTVAFRHSACVKSTLDIHNDKRQTCTCSNKSC